MPLIVYCTTALTSLLDSVSYVIFYFRNGLFLSSDLHISGKCERLREKDQTIKTFFTNEMFFCFSKTVSKRLMQIPFLIIIVSK